jgi:glycosyltransferase involved in cell wall biosynthesis
VNKKKILHLSQPTGGVKTYVVHIINYADKAQFDFVMVAPENEIFEKFCAENSIPYYPVNLHRGNHPLTNYKAFRAIVAVIKKEKPDIIHAHSAKGGFLGRLAAKFTKHTKVIYTPHAFSYLPFTGFKRMAFFAIEVMSRTWTTLLLAISYSEANRAIHELGYPKSTVKTILNSIPIPAGVNERLPGKTIKIRMIGRLTPQKNHLLFLEIANTLLQKYPFLEFSVLGAGIHDELSETIDAFLVVNNLKNKIAINLWGDSHTSKAFLEDTDIFVMTSVFEGLPFSLLEAMSLKIPCVVSKVDGNTDVIQNGENGFSCLSLAEFCGKIELLVNDAGLRQSIGLNAYNYVAEHHDIAKNIKLLEDVYNEI